MFKFFAKEEKKLLNHLQFASPIHNVKTDLPDHGIRSKNSDPEDSGSERH